MKVYTSAVGIHTRTNSGPGNQSFRWLPFSPVQFKIKIKMSTEGSCHSLTFFSVTISEFPLIRATNIHHGQTPRCRPTHPQRPMGWRVVEMWGVGCRGTGKKAVPGMSGMFVFLYPPWRVEINTTLSWSCSWYSSSPWGLESTQIFNNQTYLRVKGEISVFTNTNMCIAAVFPSGSNQW